MADDEKEPAEFVLTLVRKELGVPAADAGDARRWAERVKELEGRLARIRAAADGADTCL